MKTAKTHDRKTKKSKYSQHTPSKRLTTKPKNLNIVNEKLTKCLAAKPKIQINFPNHPYTNNPPEQSNI